MNKWLVSITGMAAAAGAMAAVESANVVGYVKTPVTQGTYYMVGVPFEAVSGTAGEITFDDLIKLDGIEAYEDGDEDCPEIQVRVGNGYSKYYYITDAWDENDDELGYDAWANGGYECTDADIQSLGDGFWFKAPVAAAGASITTKGQVTDEVEISVSFPGGGSYNIIANPFPVGLCFADVTTTGITAKEDGDPDSAEIQVRVGNGYSKFYYITDAWDENDDELGFDAWADGGYECVGVNVPAGASFWVRSFDNGQGTITFSL